MHYKKMQLAEALRGFHDCSAKRCPAAVLDNCRELATIVQDKIPEEVRLCLDNFEVAGRVRQTAPEKAAELYATCQQAQCPGEIRTLCQRNLAELHAARPTVILVASTADGQKPAAVRAYIDQSPGYPLETPIPVFAGSHVFGVDWYVPDVAENVVLAHAFKRVVVRPGEANQVIELTLDSEREARSEAAAAGIGSAVVSLGFLTTFIVLRVKRATALDCGARCSPEDGFRRRKNQLYRSFSLSGAVAAAAGATYFALSAIPPASESDSVASGFHFTVDGTF